MINEGEILEKAIRQSGFSIEFISKKVGYSRRHLYNLFKNERIPVDLFLAVSKIINYDFSQDLKKMKYLKRSILTDNEEKVSYWKNKYLELLEKYNKLLEEKTK